jgi:hypothetical protein
LKHDNHIPSRAPQHNAKLTRRRKRSELASGAVGGRVQRLVVPLSER